MLFQSPQSQPPLMHLARCIDARFVSQCRKESSPPLISDLAPHIWCTSFVSRYQGIGAHYRYPDPLLIGYVYVRTWNHRFRISTSRAMCESGTMGAGPAHGSFMSYYHTKTRVAPTTRVIETRHTEYVRTCVRTHIYDMYNMYIYIYIIIYI